MITENAIKKEIEITEQTEIIEIPEFDEVLKKYCQLSGKEQDDFFLSLEQSMQIQLLPYMKDDGDNDIELEKEIIKIESEISLADCLINSGLLNFLKSNNKLKKHIIDRNYLFLYKEVKSMSDIEKVKYESYKKKPSMIKKDFSDKLLHALVLSPELVKLSSCFEFIIPLQPFQIELINKVFNILNNPVFKELNAIVEKLDASKLYTKIIEKEI